MLKLSRLTALLLLGFCLTGNASAEEKSAALVNGVSIPQSRVEMHVKNATAQGQPDSPELRKAIRERLIEMEILAQEAVKQGVDKQPDTQQQLDMAKQNVLVDAYVQNYMKSHPISEETLKQEYENLKAKIGDKEYHVFHILVGSEDEAKAVLALVKKGKFDKVAKEKSKDPGSAQRGGDLGWVVPANFVPQFAEAVTKLSKGQISAPVQTQFGWHIIKLDDTRALQPPSFEEIKPQLSQRLQQQALKKAVSDLRAKAKVE